MANSENDFKLKKQQVLIALLVFLFIVAFWQSWSGVFIFVSGFLLGGFLMTLDANDPDSPNRKDI